MKIQQRHSQLINSVKICQILNNDMEYVRKALREYCEKLDFKGALLNAYNKTYIYTDKALNQYICGTLNETKRLPKKYSIEFLSQL